MLKPMLYRLSYVRVPAGYPAFQRGRQCTTGQRPEAGSSRREARHEDFYLAFQDTLERGFEREPWFLQCNRA